MNRTHLLERKGSFFGKLLLRCLVSLLYHILFPIFAFSDTHTEAKTSVLEEELEACEMLLEEEPDNKCMILKLIYHYVKFLN